MGRNLTIAAFGVLFGALICLAAVVTEQQRAIDALISDNAVSLSMQMKFDNELQSLRVQVDRNTRSTSVNSK
jgi:hypothetical protein